MMWSHLSPASKRGKSASQRLTGSDGVKFFVASLVLALTVPAAIGAYQVETSPTLHEVDTLNSTDGARDDIESVDRSTTPKPSVDTQVESGTVPSATTETTLEVNSQTIKVPDNGSVRKTIRSDDGNTKVDISVDSRSTQSDKSKSSLNIEFHSSTKSDVDSDRSVNDER